MAGQSQGNHTGAGVCGLWWQSGRYASRCAVLLSHMRRKGSQGKASGMGKAAALGLFLGLAVGEVLWYPCVINN